jgi:hypothetical protein
MNDLMEEEAWRDDVRPEIIECAAFIVGLPCLKFSHPCYIASPCFLPFVVTSSTIAIY